MKVEIPVCNRCCCCLPLRHGLLAWGYLKIIADAVSIPFVAYYYLLNSILLFSLFGDKEKHLNTALLHFALSIFAITTLMTDFIVTIVFIIGGHMKNAKLLRGYYLYIIAMLIITGIVTSSSVCLAVVNCVDSDHELVRLGYCSWNVLLITCSAYLVIVALQTYFLLLLRSEIKKLRRNGAFRFVNKAAESDCTMVGDETVMEEI